MNSIIIAGLVYNVQDARKVNDKSIREFTLKFPQYGDTPDGTIKVTCWGKLAESAIEEGSYVIVDGNLDTNKVNDRTVTSIVASRIHAGAESLTLNHVTLIGRLGQDPDVKFFESGANKASFSLAVNKTREVTNWFNIEAWSKSAEVIANYVRKGSQIGVTASLAQEFWTKDGEERSTFKVKVDRVELLGGKRDNDEREPVGAASNDIDF